MLKKKRKVTAFQIMSNMYSKTVSYDVAVKLYEYNIFLKAQNYYALEESLSNFKGELVSEYNADIIDEEDNSNNFIAAPTYAEVFDFLANNKLYICITPIENDKFDFELRSFKNNIPRIASNGDWNMVDIILISAIKLLKQ